MKISDNPDSFWYGWNTKSWSTPFSAFRFGIPYFCDFYGKAIYCDSDFIFLKDIAQLWNQEFEHDKVMMCKGGVEGWRTCLIVWNNPVAKNHLYPLSNLKSISDLYRKQINSLTSRTDIIQQFQGDWNNVDGEDTRDLNTISALHYSSMEHQLHIKYALPRLEKMGIKHWYDGKISPHWRQDLQELFDQYYNEAINNGYTVEKYVPDKIINYKKESQANYNHAHRWVK